MLGCANALDQTMLYLLLVYVNSVSLFINKINFIISTICILVGSSYCLILFSLATRPLFHMLNIILPVVFPTTTSLQSMLLTLIFPFFFFGIIIHQLWRRINNHFIICLLLREINMILANNCLTICINFSEIILQS